ncbi:MAG: hypothetical protein ABJD24_17130 [Acidimicrobiales bacterium]
MGWHDMNGWNWVWMTTMMLVFLGVVAAVVIVLLRRPTTGAEPRQNTAEDTLRSRLARGEIDVDEYHQLLDTLRP